MLKHCACLAPILIALLSSCSSQKGQQASLTITDGQQLVDAVYSWGLDGSSGITLVLAVPYVSLDGVVFPNATGRSGQPPVQATAQLFSQGELSIVGGGGLPGQTTTLDLNGQVRRWLVATWRARKPDDHLCWVSCCRLDTIRAAPL
jgi:hypothetical protein